MDISTKTVLLTVFVVAFTAVAAVVDWRTQKLPNWLTVPCFLSALVFHFVAGLLGESGGLANAFVQLMWALAGFATGFGILYVLWLVGGGGGGDVKMMGALGAWLMPQAILYVFLLTAAFTVIWYFKTIVTGEQARLRKALGRAKRTGSKEKVAMHHAPYAFRAGLAVWVVLGYFLVVHNVVYPFLSS